MYQFSAPTHPTPPHNYNTSVGEEGLLRVVLCARRVSLITHQSPSLKAAYIFTFCLNLCFMAPNGTPGTYLMVLRCIILTAELKSWLRFLRSTNGCVKYMIIDFVSVCVCAVRTIYV